MNSTRRSYGVVAAAVRMRSVASQLEDGAGGGRSSRRDISEGGEEVLVAVESCGVEDEEEGVYGS